MTVTPLPCSKHRLPIMADIRRLILAGMLLLPALPAWTQGPERLLRHFIHSSWNSQDGLPQNSINGMVQGPQGYLWLATFDGLVRFDGTRFERMPDTHLPGRRLRIVGHGSDGFWISGEFGGLSWSDGRIIKRVPIETHGITSRVAAATASDDGLWVGALDGLYHIDDSGRVSSWRAEDGLPAEAVWTLSHLPDGRLFIGTVRGLVVARQGDPDDGLTRIEHFIARDMIYALEPDGAGGIYAAGERGLLHIDSSNRPRAIPVSRHADSSVRSVMVDQDRAIWAGVVGEGLVRITGSTRETFGAEHGLLGDRFTSLYEDRERNLWYGTNGDGLGQLRRGKVVAFGDRQWGMSTRAVTSIIADPGDDGLWLGFNCEGLGHFDEQRLQRIYDHRDGLANQCVYSLLATRSGQLLVGTHGGGIFRLDGGQFKPVALPSEHQTVLALYQQSDDTIWAGGDRGLLRYDQLQGQFVAVDDTADWHVQFITEDEHGLLWIGTIQGVFHGLPEHGFRQRFGGRVGHVRAVYPDGDGHIWIGSYGRGLFRFDGRKLFRFGPEHGFGDSVVSRIIADDSGHFWLTGNRGIHGLVVEQLHAVAEGRRQHLDVVSMDTRDGMLSAETSGGGQPAGMRGTDGHIWVPTINGIVRFHPEEINRNPVKPPVVIERVVIDGHSMPPDELPVLPADARNIEIHYTGLSLAVPERVRFRYRLGKAAPWTDAGNRRVAYFTAIPGGEHVFQVIAANNDGLWNEQGASIRLRAAAPFHQTIWFPFSVAAAATLFASLLWGIRMRAAHRRESELARVVHQRTEALEEANRKLHSQARMDGLTGIANRRYLEETLQREWGRARRHSEPLSLIVIDIDHFKEYNDVHGHLKGDDCLRQVVEVIAGCLARATDFVARYGGEEFVAVLPNTETAGARIVAGQMINAVVARAIAHGASKVCQHVTVSAGVAGTDTFDSANAATELLNAADTALYQAKRSGRNAVCVADHDVPDSG